MNKKARPYASPVRSVMMVPRYKIEITLTGASLEMIARVVEHDDSTVAFPAPDLQANVCNLNLFYGLLLTEAEQESGKFADAWFDFPTAARAQRAYRAARAYIIAHPTQVAAAFDKDRIEGEWDFPSDVSNAKKEA